jgi:hypothetical protein
MLFCKKAETAAVKTADAGKIRLGGACRLPVATADTGKIRLGGACRLPVAKA